MVQVFNPVSTASEKVQECDISRISVGMSTSLHLQLPLSKFMRPDNCNIKAGVRWRIFNLCHRYDLCMHTSTHDPLGMTGKIYWKSPLNTTLSPPNGLSIQLWITLNVLVLHWSFVPNNQ